METCDDKSEGKTSIHRLKTLFTYLILAISFFLKILYTNCMLFYFPDFC